MRAELGTRTFAAADLDWFAAASGDYNPIHVDAVAARRLLTGSLVVHGMYTLLWALDRHFATGGGPCEGVAAYFPHPVRPGEALVVTREAADDAVRLSVMRAGEEVAILTLKGSADTMSRHSLRRGNGRPGRGIPVEHTFDALRGLSGSLAVDFDAADIALEFPHVAEAMGETVVAAFATLSRLVGMEAPGLHSLFAGLDIRLDRDADDQAMQWEVIRHTIPVAPLRLKVSGGRIAGHVEAIMRPAPIMQPQMHEVAGLIEAGAFSGQRALIVGGSRGLGEVTAKLVAAGGGEALITYLTGRADAERVVAEIEAWGGRCAAIAADASQPEALLLALGERQFVPTHIYYFPTPKISKQKGFCFNLAAHYDYVHIYVDAFSRLVSGCAGAAEGQPVRVFYPSTAFLDENPKGFAEYITAKAAGEAMCRYLEKTLANLRIDVRRLPRLKTDQTTSLIPQTVAALLPQMVRVVTDMNS